MPRRISTVKNAPALHLTMKITEGYMPFGQYRTWYRIAAEDTGKTPLVLLHGGPGSTHNYFELLDPLAETGRQVISYDQLGCGNSFLDGHPELWNADTWLDELDELRLFLGLKRVHLLGQSWGGMMIIDYLIRRKPEGIASVILSSTLPSASLWAREQHRMIRQMPEEEQEAIRRAEETGNYEEPAYLAANEHYMQLHCAGPFGENDPECLKRPKKSGRESYVTGWGPNEYTPSGTLKDFEYLDRLGEITVPTLIISGVDDLCTPLVAKSMYDRIPGSRWELFEGARHMCFADQTEHYLKLMREWLG